MWRHTLYALLLAPDTDEKAILTLVLQRAGLAVTSSNDLERAMSTWPERPSDVIVLALPVLLLAPRSRGYRKVLGNLEETAARGARVLAILSEGDESLAEMERRHIAAVLDRHQWNIVHAAAALRIDRATLYNKIKKYHLRD